MTQSTTHATSSPCRRLVRKTVVLDEEAANSSALSSSRSSDATEGGLAAPAGCRSSFTKAVPARSESCVERAKSPAEAATTRTIATGDFAHADGTRGHCARARCADERIEAAQCPPYGSSFTRAHPDWIESGCALDSLALRMSLSENRFPLFRDMR